MKSQPKTRHMQQLSAYLDGQLPAWQTARLEKRLGTDADLRAEYETLLYNRSLLRGLPSRRVPRNFTLTPDMVRAPRRQLPLFLVPTLRFSSSAAALVLVLTFVLELAGGLAPRMAMTAQEAIPQAAMEMAADAPQAEATPMILLWNAQPPGMGGGMDTPAEGLGGGPASELPMGGALALDLGEQPVGEAAPAAEAPALASEEEILSTMTLEMEAEEPAAAKAAPETGPPAAMPPPPSATQVVPAAPPAPQEPVAAEITTVEDQNFILGIPPAEEQGRIQTTETQPSPIERPAPVQPLPARRLLQIGLAIFAGLTGSLSLMLSRKRRV